jgi:GNAT superfamily N-acetyltransferase
MHVSAAPTNLGRIRLWRDMHLFEMNCQVVHDSIHDRPGWTKEFLLSVGDTPVGYGSLAIGGPWKDTPTLYQVYVVPTHRQRLLDLCRCLVEVSEAVQITIQSNDPLATVMLHAHVTQATSNAILFHDRHVTALAPAGAIYRSATAAEAPDASPPELLYRGVVDVDGQVAATGGVLFHYNRPFGDIYMEVNEAFRQRGLGSFIVQELKRICYENGHIPAARTNTDNIASQRTLQKAGFVPCGHILTGPVRR